ncbi:hypothetical protein D3C76_345360 [compost metagenome]
MENVPYTGIHHCGNCYFYIWGYRVHGLFQLLLRRERCDDYDDLHVRFLVDVISKKIQ